MGSCSTCRKTKRSKPTLVNEVWFGDHHKLDLFVLDEKRQSGAPVDDGVDGRLLTAVCGLGADAGTEQRHGGGQLCRAAVYTKGSDVHGLPRYIYIDNGKDYRSHRFEGETLVETDLGCLNAEFSGKGRLASTLGVGVHHALPYRGWSKDRGTRLRAHWKILSASSPAGAAIRRRKDPKITGASSAG